jgi:hypothetical protein
VTSSQLPEQHAPSSVHAWPRTVQLGPASVSVPEFLSPHAATAMTRAMQTQMCFMRIPVFP